MPVARPESSDSRVIAHVDMDCFYVQVEQRKQPDLRGQPTAVVQYNTWKGGGLIAVSYEARKYGVKRSMRGDEAKEVCPQINLVQVPVNRGKADLTVYRNAGSEVVSILSRKGRCERASIDEVYLDLTDAAEKMLADTPPEALEEINEEALKSHILGLVTGDADVGENVKKWLVKPDADRRDKLLACGAFLVAELRLQVLQETQFTCSAGIAHNKMLAKLVSGMNKPAQQTVVPSSSVAKLLQELPIKKMKQLGGKLGTSILTDLRVETVGDLLRFPEAKLQEHYGVNTGTWLWNVARGISGEEVDDRLLPKSHGAGKTFPGRGALKTISAVENWLNQLSEELSERLQTDLEKNKRMAYTLTLHASAYKSSDTADSHKKFPSKSCSLRYGTAKIQEDAITLFQAGLREYLGSYKLLGIGDGWGITGLSISASKIVAIPSGTRSISDYFHSQAQNCISIEGSNDVFEQDVAKPSLPSGNEFHIILHSPKPNESRKEDEERPHAFPACTPEDNGMQCASPGRTPLSKSDRMITSRSHQDGFGHETETSSFSGNQICFTCNHSEQCNSPQNEISVHATPKEVKTSTLKEKGTPSILQFFRRPNSSCMFSKQEHVNTVLEAKASSSSVTESVEEAKEQSKTDEMCSGTVSCAEQQLRRNEWGYDADEIDPDVLNQLPLEIQDEINASIRPRKRANLMKKASTIAHYFLPKQGK